MLARIESAKGRRNVAIAGNRLNATFEQVSALRRGNSQTSRPIRESCPRKLA